jgi:hypothetical protein
MNLARSGFIMSLVVAAGGVEPVLAQVGATDLKSWRLMTLVDLRLVGPQQAPYAAIWNDLISRNNARFQASRPASVVRNAPAVAANVIIRSPQVTVVLSILHAQVFCERVPASAEVWRCPMRLARFENGQTSILEGKGCFATGKPGAALPIAYASYDMSSRAIRLGVIFEGKAVEGCSQSVPVKRESEW